MQTVLRLNIGVTSINCIVRYLDNALSKIAGRSQSLSQSGNIYSTSPISGRVVDVANLQSQLIIIAEHHSQSLSPDTVYT
jgi:hypothetical protein